MERCTSNGKAQDRFSNLRHWATIAALIVLVLILPVTFAWIGFFGIEGDPGHTKHIPGHGILGAFIGFVIGIIADCFCAAIYCDSN